MQTLTKGKAGDVVPGLFICLIGLLAHVSIRAKAPGGTRFLGENSATRSDR